MAERQSDGTKEEAMFVLARSWLWIEPLKNETHVALSSRRRQRRRRLASPIGSVRESNRQRIANE